MEFVKFIICFLIVFCVLFFIGLLFVGGLIGSDCLIDLKCSDFNISGELRVISLWSFILSIFGGLWLYLDVTE